MPEPVIQLEHLSFAYNGDTILDDVSLTVDRGEFVVLLGPNGGGKTTLVKCLLGLLTPQRGTVRVLGHTPPLRPGAVGYVPQQTVVHKGLPITVEQVVQLGLRARSMSGAERKARALDALQRVGLTDCLHARFDELSGGQQQRALVARALAPRPGLLVFDEPTANIDPRGKHCLFELLGSLTGEATVLVVSHDLIAASAKVTRVAAVNRRILQASTEGGRSPLTPEMLALLYGTHDPDCPVDGYLAGIARMLHAPAHSAQAAQTTGLATPSLMPLSSRQDQPS
ncbi:metal ABC transporter ATP-binding protein [Megalodesulfovibrio gigas]|uniref:Putative ABC transporter n=1 Tax=Megalodesulfovibrio gigas (strain ATCC 19364 / DSM 1382 / NCIMB 9332 / VKM B-1759) TaxID=1121448 RepID=T2GEU2_MEGG1|nr:metal ABC transporter ATP-binding protein [Megalodesulfovibrio gigas]AGW14631.1 putative ABC transporter [Megalodesulfovibrio gigas DSM 1382 = ATCC 19364]